MAENWYKKQKEFLRKEEEAHNEKVNRERQNFLSKYKELYNSDQWRMIEREYSVKNRGSKDLVGYFSEEDFLKVGGNLCIMDNGELRLVSRISKSSESELQKVGNISRVLSQEASRKVLGW